MPDIVNPIGVELDEHYLKEAIARTRAAVTSRDRRRPARRSAV